MKPRRTSRTRQVPFLVKLAASGLPLLALGPCTAQVTEAVIRGVFDGLTILALEAVEDQLGLPSTTGGGAGGSTS